MFLQPYIFATCFALELFGEYNIYMYGNACTTQRSVPKVSAKSQYPVIIYFIILYSTHTNSRILLISCEASADGGSLRHQQPPIYEHTPLSAPVPTLLYLNPATADPHLPAASAPQLATASPVQRRACSLSPCWHEAQSGWRL